MPLKTLHANLLAPFSNQIYYSPKFLKKAVSFLAVSKGVIPNLAAKEALDWGDTDTTTNFLGELDAFYLKKEEENNHNSPLT